MREDNILNILSGEKKGDDEKDELQTDIQENESDTIRRKFLEQKLKTENELLAEELESHRQDRDQRKDFAMKIFGFVSLYMFGVFILLALSGVECNQFHLSDPVLITLLGTTTATIIGVFNFVARYLFHNKENK